MFKFGNPGKIINKSLNLHKKAKKKKKMKDSGGSNMTSPCK